MRRLTVTDLRHFQSYRHDPVVGLYQGWSPLSDFDAATFLAEMHAATLFQPGVWRQIGIAERITGDLIGDIGIRVDGDTRHAEIGFSLQAQSQNRGIGTEAVGEVIALLFEHTAIEKIIAITDARNAASIRLLERVGMLLVETKANVFHGEPCMEHTFAIARRTDERSAP